MDNIFTKNENIKKAKKLKYCHQIGTPIFQNV